jgi:tRNA 2-selenouridine synthase
MPDRVDFADFFAAPGTMLDVRSPAEYEQGHITGAVSFPLFSNAERAEVGTCYKQQGRDRAVELGLAIVSPKLPEFVAQAKQLSRDRSLKIHCWRGGMRSGSMAWLMETAGLKVWLLNDGYKGFRRWVHATLAMPKPILTLGGMTGSGKTSILQNLAAAGEQILDLEHLANHRGSSYGSLGMPPQPTTEQFENLLGLAWAMIAPDRPVWIEAESRMVGTCRIPDVLFSQMLAAPILQVERSRSERIQLLLEVYGSAEVSGLIAATERLEKRLGRERTLVAIEAIHQGNLAIAIAIVLDYYDKAYQHDLERRKATIYPIKATDLSPEDITKVLMEKSKFLSTFTSNSQLK